jgi:hypothetical protein
VSFTTLSDTADFLAHLAAVSYSAAERAILTAARSAGEVGEYAYEVLRNRLIVKVVDAIPSPYGWVVEAALREAIPNSWARPEQMSNRIDALEAELASARFAARDGALGRLASEQRRRLHSAVVTAARKYSARHGFKIFF